MLKNPVIKGDLDSEYDWVEYLWTHPKMQVLKVWLDAEKSRSAADYKWKRSSLFFVIVVALALGKNLTDAYNRVRTDGRLRRLGGFEPRLPRRERRALGGTEYDPTFPTRQSVDDFVNRWVGDSKKAAAEVVVPESPADPARLSDRGAQLLALLEKLAQEIAFEAILTYGLDTSRIATDGSIVLSAHRRPNPFRDDVGAEFFTKSEDDGAQFGRMHHGAILMGAPFLLASRIVKHEDGGEPGALKKVVLPQLVEVSRRLTEFAADHGIEHKGLAGAALVADGAFHNHPCIEATSNAGFLAVFNVGGDDLDKTWERKLPWKKLDAEGNVVATGENVVDLRADGALLCGCSTSRRQAVREPMERKVHERYRSATVHCEFCARTYFTTPRARDKKLRTGREQGDIDLRFDVTVPRWDRRFTALCFKGRNEMEAVNGEMRRMGLLPNGRGGENWRGLTGDFRHEFWYGVGQLIFNMRVALNLSQMDEFEEYSWADGHAGYLRNRKKIERQELLAATRRNRESERDRRAHAPRYPGVKRHHRVQARQLDRQRPDDLVASVNERAAARALT